MLKFNIQKEKFIMGKYKILKNMAMAIYFLMTIVNMLDNSKMDWSQELAHIFLMMSL